VNHLRLFRILIVTQMALTLLSVLASFRLERTLPVALQAYLKAREDAPLVAREIVIAAGATVLLALLVVAWIALLRFWRIGPWLYLASSIGGFLLVLASGPTVAPAIETAFDTAGSIVGGVILAMSFFSDLRGKFGAAPPAN